MENLIKSFKKISTLCTSIIITLVAAAIVCGGGGGRSFRCNSFHIFKINSEIWKHSEICL
jgi:hypothetical protein